MNNELEMGHARPVRAGYRARRPAAVSHDFSPMAGRLTHPVFGINGAMKRAVDIILSILLIVGTLPLMAIVALLIRLDGGPALYRHRRVGRGKVMFHCLKFRSMVLNSDEALRSLLASSPDAAREWAETQKLRNDPRITRVGRFLRATSLDELPQLFNVLRGDMSLVGPRPIVTEELARYGEHASYYLSVRPGLTGLWQVSGRSNTSYEQRVRFDVQYVQNWSIFNDLKIILITVPMLIGRVGAV